MAKTNEHKAIDTDEKDRAKDVAWNDGEWGYLCGLVAKHGDGNVGHDPKTVAAYLRLQASSAFRDKRYRLAAAIGHAATCVNSDARNNHPPDWDRARQALNVVSGD